MQSVTKTGAEGAGRAGPEPPSPLLTAGPVTPRAIPGLELSEARRKKMKIKMKKARQEEEDEH